MVRHRAVLLAQAQERLTWSKCKTRFSNPSFIREWEEKTKVIEDRVASNPLSETRPIDWDEWRRLIKDTAAVNQIQKEYESTKFVEIVDTEQSGRSSTLKSEIDLAKLKADVGVEEIPKIELEIEKWEHEKSICHWINSIEIFAKFPGAREQQHEFWMRVPSRRAKSLFTNWLFESHIDGEEFLRVMKAGHGNISFPYLDMEAAKQFIRTRGASPVPKVLPQGFGNLQYMEMFLRWNPVLMRPDPERVFPLVKKPYYSTTEALRDHYFDPNRRPSIFYNYQQTWQAWGKKMKEWWSKN